MSDIRVLIVDDDFRVGGMHRDIVAGQAGFTPFDPVRSIADARSVLRTDTPELLLVDVYLPDGDGIEFVRASGLDAFVLSAASDAGTVRRAVRAGALGYLVKPFDTRSLGERLDRYARYRNLIEVDRALSQEEIDRAAAIVHGAADAASVSRSATEQLILGALGTEEASAAEIAERTGISRATAQRHLSALATRGLVDVGLRYGSTGRPEHRYRSRKG
jgi:two-component system CitB family response regulator